MDSADNSNLKSNILYFQGCNFLYDTAQFEASRAELVEILLDFNKLGKGTDIPNTNANFEKMKECLATIMLSDPTVSF